MTNREKAQAVFAEELSWITDPRVKESVLEAFDKVSKDYFFTAPASTSGKYHPAVNNGRHGLIRHTKMVVWIARDLLAAFDLKQNNEASNDVIAASLLHDILKFGYHADENGKGSREEYKHHGQLGAIGVASYVNRDIANAVAGHMGVWSCEEVKAYRFTLQRNVLNEIVMLADYMSSRKIDTKTEKLLAVDYGKLIGE